jgi:DNA-binding Lrp family transcriptional regulator
MSGNRSVPSRQHEHIAELLKAAPTTSNREIGAAAGTTHKVAARIRRELEAAGHIAQVAATIGKDGRSRPRPASKSAGNVAKPRALFDPETGAFAANIRDIGGDDSELRSSLKEFGWIKEFPALVDENGVVLVGHRRLKIAEEEKIEPVVKKLALGGGDAADAERLKLALVSNIGSKPMTAEDRKRIAQHLYGEREWTMKRIAEALNVSHGTVVNDLRNLSDADKLKHAKSMSNPKGAGRPKGSRSKKPNSAPAVKKPQHAPVEPTTSGNTAPPIAPLVEQTSERREPEPIDSSPETHELPGDTPAAQEPAPMPSASDELSALKIEAAQELAPMPSASDELSALKIEAAALRAALASKISECGYDLVDVLWALHGLMLIGELAEKNLSALIKAKPPFDYLGLLDLGKAIVNLGHAWKSRERRVERREPAQNNTVPPINDPDPIPDFLRRATCGQEQQWEGRVITEL